MGSGGWVHANTHEIQHATHALNLSRDPNIGNIVAAENVMRTQASENGRLNHWLTERFIEQRAWNISQQTLSGQALNQAENVHNKVLGDIDTILNRLYGIPSDPAFESILENQIRYPIR